MSALPSWGRRLAPSRKALPFLPRSYGLMRQASTLPPISGTPLFERSLQVATSPCCVKALPNAISVVLPYVPGPLLQLLPRCCLPFLPLGHWPSPSEHGSALGFAPPLLLRMVKILELQSFHYVPAHRFARLTGSSYPHTLMRVGQPRLLRPRISRLVTYPVQRLCYPPKPGNWW